MKPVRIFVRIGALRRFHVLKRKTEDLPVEVSWDRRRAQRRDSRADITDEQRRHERRQQPPYTWEVADFVVVEEPPDPKPPRRPRRR